MRETEVEKSSDETRDMMFDARRDRAQMARRLDAEIVRRDELEKERQRAFMRYKIADRISGFFHRIPLLPGIAKAIVRPFTKMRRSNQKETAFPPSTEARNLSSIAASGFGVNLAGHLNSEKGVGEGARATLRSIRAAEIPCQLVNSPDSGFFKH